MKKAMLLIMLSGLSHKAHTQAHGGVGQYFYMGERQPFTLVPIVYYQTAGNWYVEGRYNYEALKTMSVYAGKVFEKKSALSFSASPVIGAVIGQFNGGSIGINNELDYKKLLFSSQLQYTFSIEDRTDNFFYSWSDLSYQAINNIYAGFSVQQTSIYRLQRKLEKGFFVKALVNKWTLPFYIFSPVSKERYFVLGITHDW